MQICLPNLLTRQGAIGLMDYLCASRDNQDRSNIIFNSDLNLEDLSQMPGGTPSILDQHIENGDSLMDFLGFAISNLTSSSAQLLQDLYVLWKTGSKINGKFLEIGVGYPTGLNNTYLLESRYGWNGIGIEPNPAFHEYIQKERTFLFFPNAVHTQSNTTVTLCVPNNFDPGSYVEQDYEAKIEIKYDIINQPVSKFTASTVTLVDCLTEYQMPKIFDYCSYDTTGSVQDIEIIKSMLDAGWRPQVLSIGHNYKSYRHALHNMLQSYDYDREFEYLSKWDDWYYHNTVEYKF